MSTNTAKQRKLSTYTPAGKKSAASPRPAPRRRSAKQGSPSPAAGAASAPAGAASGAAVEPSSPPAGSRAALDVWRNEAMRLPSGARRTRVPLHVLLDEAVAVARFFDTYYPTLRNDDGTVARVGLDSVARPGRELTAATGAEVLSLRQAIQEAQAKYVAASAARDRLPIERARFLVREMRSALTFLFDDGKRDVKDVQLEQLTFASGSQSRSESALALQLYQIATLAEMHRAELDGLGGFDTSLIDEAFALNERMRSLGPVVPFEEIPSGVLDLRQRLATLLADRMGTIRSAARFVFRRSPAIVRESTSTYERRRGAAARTRRAGKDDSNEPRPPRKRRAARPTKTGPS